MNKDKEKKQKKSTEKSLKPSSTLDYDALELAIVDGKLEPGNRQLVLKRDRTYDMITFVRVSQVYPNGDVSLLDDTLGEMFSFNLHTDIRVHDRLRVYDKSKVRKAVLGQKVEDDVSVDCESDPGATLDDPGRDSDELAVVVEDASS